MLSEVVTMSSEGCEWARESVCFQPLAIISFFASWIISWDVQQRGLVSTAEHSYIPGAVQVSKTKLTLYTSSDARVRNTWALSLSSLERSLARYPSLQIKTQHLTEGQWNPVRVLKLEWCLGRPRIHFPIPAWNDSRVERCDSDRIQVSQP